MQAIATAARRGIIKRQLKIVVAEEPVESRPGFAAPAAVTRYPICLQTSRNGASGFKWLLIEAGLLAILAIKPLRTNWDKVAVGFAPLHFQQPLQRFESSGNHALIRASCANQQHGLGQSGVAVGQNVLKPFPIGLPDGLIHFEKTATDGKLYFLCIAISGIRSEILLNAEQGICPSTRAAEFNRGREREFKQTPGRAHQSLILRAA